MTPFAYHSTCYLLDGKYSTLLDSIYKKLPYPFHVQCFKVLSSEVDLAEIRSIGKAFIIERY